jgi:hypothetical protein
MSLSTNVSDLATRIATEIKTVYTKIGPLPSLTTANKTNLVLAINEVAASVGTAGATINDASASTLTVYSSTKTNAQIAAATAALVDSSPALLDTLNELAAALGDDPNFAASMTTALGTKAPLASPTFTGTVNGITKAMVGLGAVDNTADAAKPISTAQQAALDAKAPLVSPNLSGTPTAPTASALTSTSQIATTSFVTAANALKANLASPTFTGVPAAPTAANGTNTTQIATTAFVTAADALKADANATVNITGNQTIGGIKTFTSSPIVPDATFSIAKVIGLQTALDTKADIVDVGSTITDYVAVFNLGLV